MVLCVETPYYELGWGGMMVEDIIVSATVATNATKLPRELGALARRRESCDADRSIRVDGNWTERRNEGSHAEGLRINSCAEP